MNSNKSVTANFQAQIVTTAIVTPAKIFSPDNKGDIGTETWTIDNAYLLDGCEIVIYNRQGQKVYTSVGYPTPWNGTVNGKPLPDGAYFYIIHFPDNTKKTGSVTIARLK
jgi:gliding motility-associated-like protein